MAENTTMASAMPAATDVRTIKVIVKHCKTRDGKKDFDAYRAVQTDGKLMDCRFRACVTNIPKENFVMKVDAAKMNVSRQYEYPRLWVSEVIEFAPVPRNGDGGAADAFGVATTVGAADNADEPLPF